MDDSVVVSAFRFSIENSITFAAKQELLDATPDTGPLDSGLREREYDSFYGTSPLSSPCPSPVPSRPASPVSHIPTSLDAPTPLDQARRPAKRSHSSPEPQSKSGSSSKARRDKKKAKQLRRKHRQASRAANVDSTRMPASSISERYIKPSKEEKVAYSAESIPSASTGYVAKPDVKGRVHTLSELINDRGFKLIQWDGRTPRPIVDRGGRVVAVLAGQPNDPHWSDIHEEAYNLLCKSAPACGFTKKATDHRRGQFPALNAGLSFGGGQTAPGNLYHPPARAGILDGLLQSSPFNRLAGFASSAFKAWMPDLHRYYSEHLDALLGSNTRLRRNFSNSVWSAVAFNFGPRTVTAKHRDFANLPFGICSVTALGSYDPLVGGHIVLWDLGLVIEFPPGSTVLIPSAAVAHSNTPISPHETRGSFTQYSAGGLFRWVDHGFQKDEFFLKGLSEDAKQELSDQNSARCKLGLSLFPLLNELRGRSPEK